MNIAKWDSILPLLECFNVNRLNYSIFRALGEIWNNTKDIQWNFTYIFMGFSPQLFVVLYQSIYFLSGGSVLIYE